MLGVEYRCVHLQSRFSCIVVTLEPVRLLVSVAVNFVVELVADYFALLFVDLVF